MLLNFNTPSKLKLHHSNYEWEKRSQICFQFFFSTLFKVRVRNFSSYTNYFAKLYPRSAKYNKTNTICCKNE